MPYDANGDWVSDSEDTSGEQEAQDIWATLGPWERATAEATAANEADQAEVDARIQELLTQFDNYTPSSSTATGFGGVGTDASVSSPGFTAAEKEQLPAATQSLPSKILDSITSRYTTSGVTDWLKVGKDVLTAGAAYKAYQQAAAPAPKTGYQGGIPSYKAVRSQLEPTGIAAARPGAGGQRYFTDTQYTTASGLPAAQAADTAQKATLEAQNLARQQAQIAQAPKALTAAEQQAASDKFYGNVTPTTSAPRNLTGYAPAAVTPTPTPTGIATLDTYKPNTAVTTAPVATENSRLSALPADKRATVIEMAKQRAAASGKSPEQELYDYAQTQGLSNDQIDTMLGLPAGATVKWLDGTKAVPTAAPVAAPAVSREVALNPEQRNTVVSMANQRAAASGKTPEQELYNYAQTQGISNPQIDTMMGLPTGATQNWLGGQTAAAPTGIATLPTAAPAAAPALSRDVAMSPEQRATVISMANQQAGAQGIAPEQALYNYAQTQGLSNANIDTMMGLPTGATQNWLGAQTTQPTVQAAQGGLMGLAKGGSTTKPGGTYLQGSTDGMADELHATIDGNQPARLAHGEFVIPADVVSHLGNGNSDAGAKQLYSMMDKIRQARTGTKKQGKEINPEKFTPGGIAGYAAGGSVQHFVDGGATGAASGVTGTESNLSNWAGPYVTDMLGKGQAISETPYQAYQGPLTAGESSLQTQGFGNAANIAVPTSIGTAANVAGNIATAPQTTSFTAPDVMTNYMSPYQQGVVDVQQREAQRMADIATTGRHGEQVKQGAYGGSRGAIMDAEAARNLAQQQGAIQATGLQNAFAAGQQQFNTEQTTGLAGQTLNLNAANVQGQLGGLQAQTGLAGLSAQLGAGAQQRDITSQGVAADKAAFEAERDNPYKMVQYQQSLLQGLPLAAQSYSITNNPITAASGAASAVNTMFGGPAAKYDAQTGKLLPV